MLKHNLLLFFRNIKKNKSTFFINIIGLSTGLACVLLIYLWVNDELKVDDFHQKGDRLFNVMGNYQQPDNIITWNGTSAKLAEALVEEVPEIELAAGATDPDWQMSFDLSVGDKKFKSVGKFVGKDYFRMFSYELIEGN